MSPSWLIKEIRVNIFVFLLSSKDNTLKIYLWWEFKSFLSWESFVQYTTQHSKLFLRYRLPAIFWALTNYTYIYFSFIPMTMNTTISPLKFRKKITEDVHIFSQRVWLFPFTTFKTFFFDINCRAFFEYW